MLQSLHHLLLGGFGGEKVKRMTFKQWLLYVYGLKFEVYMEVDADLKSKCRKEYAKHIKEVTQK